MLSTGPEQNFNPPKELKNILADLDPVRISLNRSMFMMRPSPKKKKNHEDYCWKLIQWGLNIEFEDFKTQSEKFTQKLKHKLKNTLNQHMNGVQMAALDGNFPE